MELKAETIVPQGSTITLQMYPKADVDNYIRELNDKLRHYPIMVKLISLKDKDISELKDKLQKSVDAHNEIFDELRRTIKVKESLIDEVMHQKFMRCLDLANYCNDKAFLTRMTWNPNKMTKKESFWYKWRDRWYKIAEKFKV